MKIDLKLSNNGCSVRYSDGDGAVTVRGPDTYQRFDTVSAARRVLSDLGNDHLTELLDLLDLLSTGVKAIQFRDRT